MGAEHSGTDTAHAPYYDRTSVPGKTEERTMSKSITRRRFLVLGGGASLSTFLGGAYVVSACPLSDSGVCVGPCAAYIDRAGDGICDRAYADRAAAQAVARVSSGAGTVAAESTTLTRCPLGLVNDPYPGECQHYIDQDGDGFCDLSQAVGQASQPDNAMGQAEKPDSDAGQASPSDNAVDQAGQPETFTVACPFGITNDPYPGQCRRYIDRDGDGICDLSIPQPVDQTSQPGSHTDQPSQAGDDVDQAFQPDDSAAPQPQLGVACPYGLVNDPYPGECQRYIDQNGDGICDLSEPGSGLNAPESATEAEEGESRRRRGWGNGRR